MMKILSILFGLFLFGCLAGAATAKVNLTGFGWSGVEFWMPSHKIPGSYPGVYWQDDKGNFLANLTAHELTNDGKSQHDHIHIKTAVKKGERADHTRLSVTIGQEKAQVQVTGYAELVTYLPPIFRGADGKTMFRLMLQPDGTCKGQPVASKDILWSGD